MHVLHFFPRLLLRSTGRLYWQGTEHSTTTFTFVDTCLGETGLARLAPGTCLVPEHRYNGYLSIAICNRLCLRQTPMSAMSLIIRFQQIKRYLHIPPPSQPDGPKRE